MITIVDQRQCDSIKLLLRRWDNLQNLEGNSKSPTQLQRLETRELGVLNKLCPAIVEYSNLVQHSANPIMGEFLGPTVITEMGEFMQKLIKADNRKSILMGRDIHAR